MNQNTEINRPAAEDEEIARNYRPLGLKAVIAAAMMLRRSDDEKAKARKAA